MWSEGTIGIPDAADKAIYKLIPTCAYEKGGRG